MIKRQSAKKKGAVKITFTLPLETAPEATSVTGDFNGWDPLAHPLKKRSNGTRSVSVELTEGEAVEFRYLADGGHWFCDDTVDMTNDGNNIFTA